MNHVAIVGVGLIGGSFALALRSAGFAGRITGVSSPAAVSDALNRGIIDAAQPLDAAIPEADLIYLAQPIGRILDTLHHLNPLVRPDALVTDAGSTKRQIVTTAASVLTKCQFLGGHPMAGKETRGAESAEADLFRGRPYVLTPVDKEDLETPAAAEFVGLVRKMGAEPVVLEAEEHDRLVAFSSHVPQLASTALAAAISKHSPASRRVAGPGLLDTTRLALSSYELWRDIIATNSAPIQEALSAYIQELEYLRDHLRTRELQEEFKTAAAFAGSLRGKQ